MIRLAIILVSVVLAVLLVTLVGRITDVPPVVESTDSAPAPSPDATVTAPEGTVTEAPTLPFRAGVPADTVAPPTTELPASTTTQAPTPNETTQDLVSSQVVSSTAYCESGRMANGEYAYDGAVSSKVLPRGSSWRVLDGPLAGRTFVVKDTGSLAYFDVAMPGDCVGAVAYGRRSIRIEGVG